MTKSVALEGFASRALVPSEIAARTQTAKEVNCVKATNAVHALPTKNAVQVNVVFRGHAKWLSVAPTPTAREGVYAITTSVYALRSKRYAMAPV